MATILQRCPVCDEFTVIDINNMHNGECFDTCDNCSAFLKIELIMEYEVSEVK